MAKTRFDKVKEGYGTLILLVGPSGSGKDSILNYAREVLQGDPGILFVRRVITRPLDDPTEDHEAMSVYAFQKAEIRGDFVISWGAHGLYYGLPASLLAHIEAGGVAIANGSRKTIPILRDQFPSFQVVNLTVKPEILAERLAKRGRESADEIKRRLERSKQLDDQALFDEATIHLDNSGDLATAGEAFVDIVRRCARR